MQSRDVRLIFAKRRSHDISTAATQAIAARQKPAMKKPAEAGFHTACQCSYGFCFVLLHTGVLPTLGLTCGSGGRSMSLRAIPRQAMYPSIC